MFLAYGNIMRVFRLVYRFPELCSSSSLTPLVLVHRNLFDFNNYAKEAGLVGKADIPIIDDKVAETDHILDNPLPTVVNKVADEAQNKSDILQYIGSNLPELDPSTAWLYVVCSAVIMRTTFCYFNRLHLNKNLQLSLPHSGWYYQKNLEYKVWKAQRDIVKMNEVTSSIAQFTSENNLSGTASWARRQFMIRAAGMFGFNCCVIHFMSLVYAPQLTISPFFWVPSLLGHDPLYVLPSLNALLSICIYQVSRRNIATSLKKSPMPSSNIVSLSHLYKGFHFTNLAFKSTGFILVMYFGLNTFLALSVQFQSLYVLFWTASNIAGLLTTVVLIESDVLREHLGLLPKKQFVNLLEGEKIVTPSIVEAKFHPVKS